MDGQEGGEKGRLMTRGQFLGTGAAAAAGVAAAGVRPGMLEGREAVESERNVPPNVTWAIPASILNILWTDFFPRLVARGWNSTSGHQVQVGMSSFDLLQVLGALRSDMVQKVHDRIQANHPTVADPATATFLAAELDHQVLMGASASLRDRIDRVIDFLRQHGVSGSQPNAFPFTVTGKGGYDFLLSEWGIEFFMPSRPQGAADLLRYYSFRNTGRPAIGLPLYLDASNTVDCPTGPSQIEIPKDWAEEMIRRQPRGLVAGCLPIPVDSLREAVACLGDEVISLAQYRCLVGGARSWQLEGSVYRGIMVELPRIIATVWMEVQNGTYTLADSYHSRVFPPPPFDANDTYRLRELFRRRLETWLPGEQEMYFGYSGPTAPVGAGSHVTSVWKSDDLMITNRGFYFPRPRGKDPLSDPPPSIDALIGEIAEGRAGNPVFTDSKRTQT